MKYPAIRRVIGEWKKVGPDESDELAGEIAAGSAEIADAARKSIEALSEKIKQKLLLGKFAKVGTERHGVLTLPEAIEKTVVHYLSGIEETNDTFTLLEPESGDDPGSNS